jgi:hypothetical protein
MIRLDSRAGISRRMMIKPAGAHFAVVSGHGLIQSGAAASESNRLVTVGRTGKSDKWIPVYASSGSNSETSTYTKRRLSVQVDWRILWHFPLLIR